MKNKFENIINSFAVKNMMLLSDLEKVEKDYNIKILDDSTISTEIEQNFYPQFDEKLRNEAKEMSKYYEIFYCLENTIRNLISSVLESEFGNEWWVEQYISGQIITEVKNRIKKEIDSGITQRSSNNIDYTTFGELSDIIKKNWSEFGAIFNSQRAVGRIMFNLNTLRNNIAHCCILSQDEIVRLELSVKDWFRIMEL